MTAAGQRLHEDFQRQLMARTRIRLLARGRQAARGDPAERQPADVAGAHAGRPLPEGIGSVDDSDPAAAHALDPAAANDQYVTLHDAVAEELALRIIPLQDQTGTAARAVAAGRGFLRGTGEPSRRPGQAAGRGPRRRLEPVNERLQAAPDSTASDEEAALIQDVTVQDARSRELGQFRAAQIYYCSCRTSKPGAGCC